MTEIGAPNVCYNPALQGFEPMPFWTRMISDGLENILDAYVYMRKKGEERPAWLAFCRKAADWFVRIQNEDGSWYRAYNTEDGSMRMESKANTISAVRFLIQLYLVTGEDSYRETALRAGEWSYQNIYRNMEYRGSTCDNTDITDNESGIYAMFGFLSLYDLTGQQKWLDALIGAADYTETWTYMWSYPMKVLWPNHPFSKNSFSGQSLSPSEVEAEICTWLPAHMCIIDYTSSRAMSTTTILLNLFTIIRARQMMWTAALDMPFQAFRTKGAILQPKHSPATIIGCPG